MKKLMKLLLAALMTVAIINPNVEHVSAEGAQVVAHHPLTWLIDESVFSFNNPAEAMIYMEININGMTQQVFCIDPGVKSHYGDTYNFLPGAVESDWGRKVIETYYMDPTNSPIWGTEAGYQAAQIAIWMPMKGVTPSQLRPKGDDAWASNEVIALATYLYNNANYQDFSGGASFRYGSAEMGNSYEIPRTDRRYKINGEYYRISDLMGVTLYGQASNLSFTVSTDNGMITDRNKQAPRKTKSFSGNNNSFFSFVSGDAAETNVTITASYLVPEIASYTWQSGAYGNGQKLMSLYFAEEEVTKTVKFTTPEIVIEEPQDYKGKITFTKTGTGIVRASSDSSIPYPNMANIQTGEVHLTNAWFAIYDSSFKRLGDAAYKTDENGILETDVFPLEALNDDSVNSTRVYLCEIQAPEGYGAIDSSVCPPSAPSCTSTVQGNDTGNIYTCLNVTMAKNGTSQLIEKTNLSPYTKDIVKTFTVDVTKQNQTGEPEADVEFGLYTTEEIAIENSNPIPANTLVAYGKTGADGKVSLGNNLPASQNYVLRELSSPNGNSIATFTYDGNEYKNEVVINIDEQEEMSVSYPVTVVNEYVGRVTIHKTDGDTDENLAGIVFNLLGTSYSTSGVTDTDGKIVFDKVPYGNYTIKEGDAPAEYQTGLEQAITVGPTTRDVTYELKNYKVPVKDVDVVKQIEGPYSEDKTFYFNIKLSKIDGTTPEEIWSETKTVDGEGTLRFTRGFPEAGTYEFEISENQELTNYPGYTNDKSVYYYTLKVENVGTGAEEHLSITEETLEKVAEPGQARVPATEIEFKNKFELAPYKMQLLLEKEVAITYGTYTGSESWRVNVAVSKDGTQIDSYQRTISPNSTAAASLSVTEPGEYKFTLNEVANSPTEFKPNNNTYTLTFNVVQQGDSLVLANEPVEVDGTTIRKDGDNYRVKIVNEWDYPYTPAKVKVNLEKAISGINPLTISQDNEFEFILYENGVEKARDSMTGRVFDLNGKAYMDFTSSEYETPTDFTLLVKEQAGTNANWQYSTDEWKIDVHVTEEDAPYKHLVASGEVYKNDILQETVEAPVCTPQAGATENNYCPEYTEFNVNFRNQYKTPDGEYEVGQIEVVKETNIATLPGEDFGFIVERASKVAGVWSEYEPLETRTWGDTKKELVSLKAKNVGEFRYRISEDKTNPIADWKYDDTVYEVTFRAIQDGENIIFAGSEIKDQDGNVKDAIVFSNKYEPAPALKTLRTIDIIKTANIETDQVFTYAYTSNVEAGGEQGMRTNNAHQAKTIEASSEGSFYYEFREVDLGLEGWNSDNTKYRYEYDVEFDETDRTLKIVSERFFINGQLTDKIGNDIKVEFENYYGIKPVKDRITIKKELIGTDLDDRFQFDITDGTNTQSVYIDGAGNHIAELVFDQAGLYEYTITEADMHYEGYVFDDTEYKVRYEIKEADGKYEIVSRDFSKNGEPFVTENVLTFTNTKEYEPVRTQIILKKTWNLEDEAAVSLRSQFNALGSVENNARIMGNGTAKLTYEFTKPGEYTYVIKEVAENNTNIVYDTAEKTVKFTVVESTEGLVVTPSVETLEFNNLYQYPSTRVLIPIEKKITGSPTENKEFIIQVDGEDKVRLTGEGTKTYYRDYKTPGEYVIEVKEKDSGYNNWTFDKTVYKVYVNVYKEGLEMKSTSIIRKGEETVDKIVFTNSYKKEEIPTKPKTPEEICNERGSSYKWNKEKEQCETVYRKPETGINW